MRKNRSLNIEVEEVEPCEFLPFIKVVLDGVERKLLLDTGANVDKRDRAGRTALSYAI